MTGDSPDIISVEENVDQVCCDGGDGALGHPVVWYRFDRQDRVECLYCDRVFVRKTAGSRKKRGAA